MKIRRTICYIAVVISCSLLVAGCASTSVKRLDDDQVVDLSGRWNDTDARLVSEEMIDDCLRRSWYGDFMSKKSGKPVVIVGLVKNKSHDHIDSEVFTKDLERSLINSGKIKFVANSEERVEVRDERDAQQQGYTRADTIKKIGQETGADYILIGSIHSIKDEIKARYVILYQVNLELIDIENNEKVWIGQKSIRKVVKRSKFSL